MENTNQTDDRQLEFNFGDRPALSLASTECYLEHALADSIQTLCELAYQVAREHGWWEKERSFGECIALMHSELSEALEFDRHGNPPSDHIPEFTGVEEELADCIIRIFDYCGRNNLRLGKAITSKMKFNDSRPYKHGKKY